MIYSYLVAIRHHRQKADRSTGQGASLTAGASGASFFAATRARDATEPPFANRTAVRAATGRSSTRATNRAPAAVREVTDG